jgi:hypothetical protein
MASIKQLARCIGLSGDISIIRDFYGYTKVPTGNQLSLLTQARLLKGRHIHLNLIRVGTNVNGWFSDADEQEIDSAVKIMRDIYATVSIGVGRVERYFITVAQAKGRDIIDSDDEAEELTDEWSVPNDALDVFFVLKFWVDDNGTRAGLSTTEGSCDKNAKGMDGSVVTLEGNTLITGQALAHEVGHYLGLDQDFRGNHSPDPNNIMYFMSPNGGQLTGGQGGVMKLHCWMRNACQS